MFLCTSPVLSRKRRWENLSMKPKDEPTEDDYLHPCKSSKELPTFVNFCALLFFVVK